MLPKYESHNSYSVAYDLLFHKCQEAVGLCNFALKNVNPMSGLIEARGKLSLFSFGEAINIQVNRDGSVAVISMSIAQFFDYGKNRKNVEKFFNQLNTLLSGSLVNPPPRHVNQYPSNQYPSNQPPSNQSPSLQILQERDVQELTRVVGVEELPLDNRFGSDDLTVEHEFSKTVRNEVVLEKSREMQGSVGFDLFSVLKNEISATLSRKTGHSFEEAISRRCTLTFTVKPGEAVSYKVIWKQKYLSGKYEVAINRQPLLVPFNAGFGLEYEISTDKDAQRERIP